MTAADKIQAARALIEPLTGHTEGPWWTDGEYSEDECGVAVIAARTDAGPLPGNPTRGMVAWASQLQPENAGICEADAVLIAAAPALRDTVAALADLADAQAQEIANLRALLREGADLLQVEADALKASIGINGEWESNTDPLDQHTVEAIRELEDWIGKVAAMQPRAALGETP